MESDPFEFKHLPKWHPRRFVPTLYAKTQDLYAWCRFDKYELPQRVPKPLPESPPFDAEDTAVTNLQMQNLLKAARRASQDLPEGTFVEIGCYRGVTTRRLAQAVAPVDVVGVDPFIGWGGADNDLLRFRRRIDHLENVDHVRETSGEAARNWRRGPVSFVFVDAVHDYWNTCHDLQAWAQHLVSGGYLAAHDTDQAQFAGTRRAVFEMASSRSFCLYSHVENLVVLQKKDAA